MSIRNVWLVALTSLVACGGTTIVEDGSGAAGGGGAQVAVGGSSSSGTSSPGGPCDPCSILFKNGSPKKLERPICNGAQAALYDALLQCACPSACETQCKIIDSEDLCFQDGGVVSGPCSTCLYEQCSAEEAACKAGADP